MHTQNPSFRSGAAIVALLVLGAIFFVIQYVPLGMPPHPVQVDDYTNVASSIADMGMRWKRPVSANGIFFFAHYAPASSYLALAAFAVINAALVLWLLSLMFAVRIPLAVVCAFGIAVFSHVSAFSHAVYLGLLTNLISHFFGLLSLLALWHGCTRGRSRWLVAALLAYALSVFAKEDFLLPPLFLALLLVLRAREGSAATLRMRWAVMVAVLVIGVGSMAWQAFDRNPFVAGLFSPETSPGPYVVDFSPAGLAKSYWRLLAEFAPAACVVAVFGWVTLFSKLPRQRIALVWYAAVVLALVLPYAIIPRTIVPARAYPWLPWLIGSGAVAWSVMQAGLAPRWQALASAAAILLALLLAWFHWPVRAVPMAEYVEQVGKNRAMVQTLRSHHGALVRQPEVGLVGLQEWGPWCAQDALYVNAKLGFPDQRWIVFVPAPTRCYTQQERNVERKQGVNVGVADLSTLCDYGDLPVLEYRPDGTGQLRRASDYCSDR